MFTNLILKNVCIQIALKKLEILNKTLETKWQTNEIVGK